jgi:hypothetical protein
MYNAWPVTNILKVERVVSRSLRSISSHCSMFLIQESVPRQIAVRQPIRNGPFQATDLGNDHVHDDLRTIVMSL